MSGEILTTRDGLVGNSPRYAGYLTPSYHRFLKDDSGAAINLTNVAPSALVLTLVNGQNPLLVKTGGGIWTILNATTGEVAYSYAFEDLADAGTWYLFITVRLPGERTPRAFDPDLMQVLIPPGGIPLVTIQDVNLNEVNGAQLSSLNPVPVSGPVSTPDGANAALGATTDTSSASTTIGLLKAIKAYLSGTLNTNTTGTVTEANSAGILTDLNNLSTATGSPSDVAWSGSGSGSEIAILKKLVAELAATLNVNVTNFPATQTVAGTVTEANSSSINTHLANIDNDSATLLPGQQGWISATGTGTANQDNALTFTQQVRKIAIYNASANNVPLEFDQTSTATSFPIPPGAFWIIDGALCTNIHVFPSTLLPINTTNGIYVKGWK